MSKSYGFEFDMFLGGPPDRRAPFPYKQAIKEAFPDLNIYDWESYTGDYYQERNNQMLQRSLMMVSLVPAFPMPGIGPELGYFYCYHRRRILGQQGLCLGMRRLGEFGNGDPHLGDSVFTEPINANFVILIWPDSVQPDFTKKTIGHYGLIVPTAEEAIEEIRKTIKSVREHQSAQTPGQYQV